MVSSRPSRWSRLSAPPRRRAALRRAARAAGWTDEGISLVEVLVAFVVLMITVVPLTYVLNTALAGATNARQKQAALQLADAWIEILSNSTPPTRNDGSGAIVTGSVVPTAPAGAITPSSQLAGTNYTVMAQYTFQAVNQQGGQSDLCTAGQPPSPTHPGVIQLQVTVSWDHNSQQVVDTTNINYPQPGVQTQGFLAVQVTNENEDDLNGNSKANRLQAIPITVSGAGLSTPLKLNPDRNGCAFAQVPPGSYTVQLGQPAVGSLNGFTDDPPFVDTSGNSSPAPVSVAVNVLVEGATNVTFDEGIDTAISYGGGSAVDGGVACPAGAGLTCLSLGNGSNKAEAAWGGNGSTWSSKALSGATQLSQVGCTSGIPSTCVGVGYTGSGNASTGVILTTSSDLGTVATDPTPSGVTDITQVACPTANGCYALAQSNAGPVLLAGAVGQSVPLQDTWTPVTPPSTTFTSLSSIACVPTSSTCLVGESSSVGGGAATAGLLRLDGDPAALATNPTWTPTFTLEGPLANVQSVGTITCPTNAECLAAAVGDPTGPTDPTILAGSIGAAGSDAWGNESTFPTGTGSVTGLACSPNDCVAIGTDAAGGPAVWTGDLTSAPDDWAQVASGSNGIPAGVTAVTGVTCGSTAGSDTADCLVAATEPSGAAPGVLLKGSLNGNWAWNPTGAASSAPILYYTGVACQAPGSGGSTCAAAGVASTGPVIVTSSGPSSSSWNVQTPSSLPGATVTGIPLETTPATTTNWTTQVTQAQAQPSNATSLPSVLYPLSSGYSIVAGNCQAEATTTSKGSLVAPPGGTASTTVPLGLLPLQVVNAGAPVRGATVTLTRTDCGATTDSYTLPATDSLGFTRSSVPYGTYTYAVNGAAVPGVTLVVQANSVQISTNALPTYLPAAAVVIQ